MNFITVFQYKWFDCDIYKDILDLPWTRQYYTLSPLSPSPLNFIRRVHLSAKLNRLCPLPLKKIWYLDLYSMIEPDSCLLFPTMTLVKMDMPVLKWLKKHPNHPKMVLMILDSMHGHSKHLELIQPQLHKFDWDLIFSYDVNDCNEFGFLPIGQAYYSMRTDLTPSKNCSDLYFIGGNKGKRERLVRAVYDTASAGGVKCNFNLVRPTDVVNLPGYRCTDKTIPYSDVLRDVMASNCVLEVVQDGQKAQTARYYEAVCYNKKLLTNNPDIVNLPFYDGRFMRVFNSVDDLDVEWITCREPIDYHYNGEFSPVRILEKIEALLR